jgi:hypothetical protein
VEAEIAARTPPKTLEEFDRTAYSVPATFDYLASWNGFWQRRTCA